MAEPFPGTHAVFAGGTTLDLYVAPTKYPDLITGIADGEKGPFNADAEYLAQLALFASNADFQHLGVLKKLKIDLYTGGGAANVAGGAADLGETAVLVTILGNGDPVSQFIRQDLGKIDSLTVDAVNAGDEHKPRTSFNVRRTETSNRVWLLQEQPLIPEDKQNEFLGKLASQSAQARYIALSSLQPSLLAPALSSIPKSVPKAVNPASSWFGNGRNNKRLPELKEILYDSGLFMVIVNNDEMSAIHGDDHPTIESAIVRTHELSKHVGIVVCTFGMDGSIGISDRGKTRVRKPVPNVPKKYHKDNGGAGDAAFAGTLVGAASGESLDRAMEMGRLSSGLAIMNNGAHGYVHNLDRLAQLARLAA